MSCRYLFLFCRVPYQNLAAVSADSQLITWATIEKGRGRERERKTERETERERERETERE